MSREGRPAGVAGAAAGARRPRGAQPPATSDRYASVFSASKK